MTRSPTGITNELLGYPPEARLLLINADDFGMYHAINEAIGPAFNAGIVRSTTLMVPCPGAAEAMRLLQANPAIRFGVHLSVIRDIAQSTWGPLTPPQDVPSLLDEEARQHLSRLSEMLARATVEHLEREFRAQIEVVLAANLAPTHLDWHCLHSGGRPDIFAMTMELAREYGLALRVASQPFIAQVQELGLPTVDHDLLDSFRIPTAAKPARYAALLRALPAGLSEWAVHPSLDDAVARTVDPEGWQVRQADFRFLVSPQARTIVQEEGIILIGYEPLQAVWRQHSA